MSVHHWLLARSYRPIRAAGVVGRSTGLTSSDRLRVLLYHDIAPALQPAFAAQLRWLGQRWTFVTPQRFASFVAGEEPVQGPNLLLTFDDGFASNRIVAEQVLNPLGIRAIFFVVPEFAGLEDRAEARAFIRTRIEIGREEQSMPEHLFNMRWADLEALLEQGHSVGAHTMTHARLSGVRGMTDLEREIAGAGDVITTRLGIPIDHFAYTFGDIGSFSAEAMAVAARRYRFVYSGLRGDNAAGVSRFALRREAVGPEQPLTLIGAFVEGAADLRYSRARTRLDEWAASRAAYSAG